MSLKFKLLTAFIICLTILSGAYFYENSRPPLITHKPPLMLSGFLSKGSVNRTLKVDLKFTEVANNSEIAEVFAHVSLPFNFSGAIKYRWILGEGVAVNEGELEGILQGLEAKEEKTVVLKVTGFSKEQNHQIKFEAVGMLAGKYLMGESMVASDLEKTFENTVQNVERIKASQ